MDNEGVDVVSFISIRTKVDDLPATGSNQLSLITIRNVVSA